MEIEKFKNINLLTRAQYDTASKDLTELWAVETPQIIESYRNGISWYNVYSNGWCEQGGYGVENTVISLFKPYSSTDYSIQLTPTYNSTHPWGVVDKTLSNFTFGIAGDTTGSGTCYWRTCGYIE